MKRLIAMFLFLALVTGGGTVVAGEPKETSPDTKVVKLGDYRDLTLLRMIRLGAAPFVNPGSLKYTAVAYKYEANDFINSPRWTDVRPLILAGGVRLAFKSTGKYKALGIHGGKWKGVDLNRDAIIEALSKYGIKVVFVSHSNALLGAKPTGKIVSWDAGVPTATSDSDTPEQ